MYFFLALISFSRVNSHKSVLKSLRTFFPDQVISLQLSEDRLAALVVVSSENIIEKKLIKLFQIKYYKNIIFNHYADNPTENLYVACAIHSYSQWERMNEAPETRQKSIQTLNRAFYFEQVRISEFRVTHSIIILQQPEVVGITLAASVLAVINFAKNKYLFQFNSAST